MSVIKYGTKEGGAFIAVGVRQCENELLMQKIGFSLIRLRPCHACQQITAESVKKVSFQMI